jgi:hypothetical protein
VSQVESIARETPTGKKNPQPFEVILHLKEELGKRKRGNNSP